MEKLLCPDKLVCDPQSANSEKEYKHWRRTFNNFVEECGGDAPDKFKLLTKYVSANVFDYIAEEEDFGTTMSVLDRLYIKKQNTIFARHQLATRRQQSSESLDEYLQILHSLSRKCGFTSVTAEIYREELVRDTFINGISSSVIRQRLLENQDCQLSQIFDQAMALDTAQKSSEAYYQTDVLPSTAATFETTSEPNVMAAAFNKDKRACFFCGGVVHKRTNCPALNAECRNCGKTGHFMKVCRGTKSLGKSPHHSAAMFTQPNSLMAVSSGVPNCLKSASVTVKIKNEEIIALVDSCSSESFIDRAVARRLNLEVSKTSRKINLASSLFSAEVIGSCRVDIKLNGTLYENMLFGVMNQLCGDMILGQDFQQQHSALRIEYGGERPALEIRSSNEHPVCNLTVSKIP